MRVESGRDSRGSGPSYATGRHQVDGVPGLVLALKSHVNDLAVRTHRRILEVLGVLRQRIDT
jgi:hypothetical protein